MQPQILLGLGAGQCGLNVLLEILNHQPRTRLTLEQPPLLPWQALPGRPGIRERIARWRQKPAAQRIGDIATFYLPYLRDAIALEPELRAVCLRRPKDEIVAAYLRHLDQPGRARLNHWSRSPEPGWTHDLVWTPTFPKYDEPDRRSALERYWDDYYAEAAELAERHPENVLILDTAELAEPAGVRRLLDFAGIPEPEQVVVQARPPISPPVRPPVPSEGTMTEAAPVVDPLSPRRCVILVPNSGSIHPECDQSLRQLESRGYEVRRVSGYAAIDQGRNQIATDALRDGFEETFWIDSDIGFSPESVERIRAHGLPLCCGIYPQKGKRALACHVRPGTTKIQFGKTGGLIEILYAGTGFLHVRRQVYLDVAQKLRLPTCNERFDRPTFPFFLPMVKPIEDGHWYLAEDYAFCERARQCGYTVQADTAVRLWHVGNYRYSWEDAGRETPRFDDFTLNLT